MSHVGLTPEGETGAITEAVAEIVEDRAVIEQAKGVLMVVYDIDADAAFDLLKSSSRHTNTSPHVVAEHLMTKFRSLKWRQTGLQVSTFGKSDHTTTDDKAAVIGDERDNDV